MKKSIFLVFVVVFISCNILSAQTVAEKIDQLITEYQNDRHFNGSALIADNFKTVFEKGYGFANMEWNIPNTPDTKFRLGSITKQFTSMLIM